MARRMGSSSTAKENGDSRGRAGFELSGEDGSRPHLLSLRLFLLPSSPALVASTLLPSFHRENINGITDVLPSEASLQEPRFVHHPPPVPRIHYEPLFTCDTGTMFFNSRPVVHPFALQPAHSSQSPTAHSSESTFRSPSSKPLFARYKSACLDHHSGYIRFIRIHTCFLDTSQSSTMKIFGGLAALAMMAIPAVIASPSLIQRRDGDDASGSVNTSNGKYVLRPHAVSLGLIVSSSAAPPERSPPPLSVSPDIRLLNLALTLEHAMQSMYDEAAANYTFDDYAMSGYPASVKGRYAQMQDHGNAHTKILTDAVTNGGGEAIGACTYKFPSTDVESFLAVSEYMETMAVNTYNGMLEHFEDKSLLTLVASIMNAKARHAAYINSIQQLNPWGTAFDYPLSLNMSFNIIGTFIHRGTCPKTNNLVTMLPVGVSDVAEITFLSTPLPDATVGLTLAYLPGPIPDSLFGAFITGTDTYYSEVAQDENGGMSVVIPEDLKAKGAVYVLLVSPDADGTISGDVEKEFVFAGPTLTMFPFASEGEAVGEHKFSLSA
ncbi:hypothetical protein NMY22_g10763 [Coprinellus aureogranulatus]|nr:hypothetical protein NMY22_g10763 [Coprinellus aureogranulatus]